MAFEIPLFDVAFTANADLTSRQFFAFKVTGETTGGTVTATTDSPVGILQNKPGSLQAAQVRILGVSKMVADGVVTAGSLVSIAATARAAMAAADNNALYSLGVALDTVANAGEVVSVLLTHPGRSA